MSAGETRFAAMMADSADKELRQIRRQQEVELLALSGFDEEKSEGAQRLRVHFAQAQHFLEFRAQRGVVEAAEVRAGRGRSQHAQREDGVVVRSRENFFPVRFFVFEKILVGAEAEGEKRDFVRAQAREAHRIEFYGDDASVLHAKFDVSGKVLRSELGVHAVEEFCEQSEPREEDFFEV